MDPSRNKRLQKHLGELLGTFIIVFVGCGTVAASLTLGLFHNLLKVALMWGVGVALAIYAVRSFSSAHLNPAVSFAFFIQKEISFKTFLTYSFAQLAGAIFAGMTVYLLFSNAITAFELDRNIIRGTTASNRSAMIFGEFFPNPAASVKLNINRLGAMMLEALGTSVLVLGIFIQIGKSWSKRFGPVFIGLTVSFIICAIASWTQAGLNPARDLGPRLVAFTFGWGDAAFPQPPFSFLTVYVLGPIIGASFATASFNLLKKK